MMYLVSRLVMPIAVAATCSTWAVSAAAEVPPQGKYNCIMDGVGLGTWGGAESFALIGPNKYTDQKGKPGNYHVDGTRILFDSGSYRGTWIGLYAVGQNVIWLHEPGYTGRPGAPATVHLQCIRGEDSGGKAPVSSSASGAGGAPTEKDIAQTFAAWAADHYKHWAPRPGVPIDSITTDTTDVRVAGSAPRWKVRANLSITIVYKGGKLKDVVQKGTANKEAFAFFKNEFGEWRFEGASY